MSRPRILVVDEHDEHDEHAAMIVELASQVGDVVRVVDAAGAKARAWQLVLYVAAENDEEQWRAVEHVAGDAAVVVVFTKRSWQLQKWFERKGAAFVATSMDRCRTESGRARWREWFVDKVVRGVGLMMGQCPAAVRARDATRLNGTSIIDAERHARAVQTAVAEGAPLPPTPRPPQDRELMSRFALDVATYLETHLEPDDWLRFLESVCSMSHARRSMRAEQAQLAQLRTAVAAMREPTREPLRVVR